MNDPTCHFIYGYKAVLSALLCRNTLTFHHLFLQNQNSAARQVDSELKRRTDVLRYILETESKFASLKHSSTSATELARISQSADHGGFVLKCDAGVMHTVIDEKYIDSHLKDTKDLSFVFPVGLRNPVNLGTLAKTCEYNGASLILPQSNTAGITPSALFHSDGALDRIKVFRAMHTRELLLTLKARKFQVVMTVPPTKNAPKSEECSLKGNIVTVLGNERYGIPEDIIPLGTHRLSLLQPRAVPGKPCTRISSLNVNAAAAVTLATLQRLRQDPLATGLFRIARI